MTTIEAGFIVKLTWKRKSILRSKMPPHNQEKIKTIQLISNIKEATTQTRSGLNFVMHKLQVIRPICKE